MSEKKILGAGEMTFFFSQMGIILNSGITMSDGLEILAEDIDGKEAKELIKDMSKMVNEEIPFYKALESTEVFPKYAINMVKIGELTGRLEEVFNGIAKYYENEENLHKSMKNALVQPMVLLFMMFLVVSVLIIKVIPVFVNIFEKFDMQIGKKLFSTIQTVSKIGTVVLFVMAFLLILVIIGTFINNTKIGKKWFNSFFSSMPFSKSLMNKAAMAKFTNAMCLMVKSGVEISESLGYSMELVNNKKLSCKIKECITCLEENMGFVETITKVKIFPGMFNQILKVSYRTGAYEIAWEKISKTYEEDIDEALYNVISFVEPVLVSILAIIIGVILIVVMLPLMSVMGSV